MWKVTAATSISEPIVTSTNGSIHLLAGGNIKQADGVKTSAAHTVTLDTDSNYWSYRLRSNEIRAANIAAETINIRGGDIKLAGNLNADNDISVKSKTYSLSCPSGMSRIAVMTGGHLAQAGNVISRDGNVTLDASSSISQQSKSRTSAGKGCHVR